MKMRTFVVFCSLINCVRMKSYPTFPVIIVETLARFSFLPFRSKRVKPILREREGSNTCIHETTKYMLCFPEMFQQIMTGIVALSMS